MLQRGGESKSGQRWCFFCRNLPPFYLFPFVERVLRGLLRGRKDSRGLEGRVCFLSVKGSLLEQKHILYSVTVE